MDVIGLLRGQLHGAHGVLEATLGDITTEQAHRAPGGHTASIAANYVHAVIGEDFLSSLIDGSQPLITGAWGPRAGISEPAPAGGSWEEWGQRVQVSLPQARAYAQAVYDQTDGIIGSLAPADLDRPLDLSRLQFGMQTVGFLLSAILSTHPVMHAGEISAIKGIQGLKGYPF